MQFLDIFSLSVLFFINCSVFLIRFFIVISSFSKIGGYFFQLISGLSITKPVFPSSIISFLAKPSTVMIGMPKPIASRYAKPKLSL